MLDITITENFAISSKDVVWLQVQDYHKIKIILKWVWVVYVSLDEELVREKLLLMKKGTWLWHIKKSIEEDLLHAIVSGYTLIYFDEKDKWTNE